ncbi:MAG: RNA polymerase sigma factor [Bacteroidia bacterium]|nr:sigma-70 family RNA polymerase sigma factor [Nitrosopumilus sp.]
MRTYITSDKDLIAQYLKGDEASLNQLIKRHRQKVFTSILIMVKDKDISEDIFQDTFIKVVKTLRSGNYNEEGKFLPWVVRIAHNLVIDHFRREKRTTMLRDTDEFSILSTLPVYDDNVEEKLIKDQIHADVRKLIEELPFEQKEVLIMRHYANMSFKDIADVTNVSINTSLGRMRYALINLRKLIDKKGVVLKV